MGQRNMEIQIIIDKLQEAERPKQFYHYIQELFRKYSNCYVFVKVYRYKNFVTELKINSRLRISASPYVLHQIQLLVEKNCNVKGRVCIYKSNGKKNNNYLHYNPKSLQKLCGIFNLPFDNYIKELQKFCHSFIFKDIPDEKIHSKIINFQDSYFLNYQ